MRRLVLAAPILFLAACKGADGATGPTGPPGGTGATGPTGSQSRELGRTVPGGAWMIHQIPGHNKCSHDLTWAPLPFG